MRLDRETIVLSAGWLFMVGAGVVLFVLPPIRSSRGLDAEVSKLTVEAGLPSDGPEVIQNLKAQLDELHKRGETRMTPIPELSDIAGLMRDLSGRLDQLGLDKRELVQGNAKQLEEASLIPMSVSLEGGFPEIYEAVRYVENLPRLVRVQRLRMALPGTSRDTIDRSGQIEAELMLDVFFQPREITNQATASAPVATEGSR